MADHAGDDVGHTVAVLGAGPAGMSCGLWLHRLGFNPVLIEKSEKFGGSQNLSPFENIWMLGQRGKTGQELAQQFGVHVETERMRAVLNAPIDAITRVPAGFSVVAGGDVVVARSLVIATGQRINGFPSVQSIPGSQHLLDSPRVCFDPGATATLGPAVSGDVVGVVGGGDNALVTAVLLGAVARHIHLFVRSGMRAFQMNKAAVMAGVAAGWITLHHIREIEEFEGREQQTRLVYRDRAGQSRDVLVDHLCLRLGFTPNTDDVAELLVRGNSGSLARTPSGHIATERWLRTSIPHVYAAGDVANPRDPCVATAIADGAIAARSIEEDLAGVAPVSDMG